MVVPAAGRGTRFGSDGNKIWASLSGRSVLEWTLDAFQSHPEVDHIVIAAAPEEIERVRQAAAGLSKLAAVTEGGATRADSVGRGLAALPANCEYVLVHDAARPAVSAALITRVLEAVRATGAAIPGLPVSDTLKRADEQGSIEATVSRDDLWAVQTPQGARVELLRGAYAALGAAVNTCTDEAGVLESVGIPVKIVPGEESNRKITRAEDLSIIGRAHQTIVRTGIGYDVHQFAEGRSLWLGGVQIDHPIGLKGHSDADVVLHAICDALLGAAGMGDIGILFPDTDAAHKDRPSIEFVREVAQRLTNEGWSVVNVDVALLAEAPRVAPHRERMAATIANALGVDIRQINIKATTAEKMGFVGRREGMACTAIATISS